jgi:MFS family permease
VGTAQLLQQGGEAGYGLNLDAFHAGLWMAPTALVFGACAPLSAAMIRRVGSPITLLVGTLVMAVAYVARVFASATLWQVVVGSVVVGIGTSMAFAAMPSLIMAAVPRTETAQANGLNTLLRSVGTATASAAIAALLTGLVVTAGGAAHPTYAAFATAFWLAAAAAAAAGVLAVPLVRAA